MTIRFLQPQKLKYVREKINGDPEFNLAARYMTQNILLAAGESQCILKIRDGLVSELLLNPSPMEAWDFFIKAPEKSWEIFLLPLPPPFYHSLFGASIRQDFQFGGNIEAMFAHYWATQRMLAILRQLQND
jgi:hypothetical protein